MNKKLRNFDTNNNNFESLSVGDLPEKKVLKEVLQPEMKKKKKKGSLIYLFLPLFHLPLDSDSKSIIIDHARGGCDLTSLTFCFFLGKMGLITHANMKHNKWKTSKILGT